MVYSTNYGKVVLTPFRLLFVRIENFGGWTGKHMNKTNLFRFFIIFSRYQNLNWEVALRTAPNWPANKSSYWCQRSTIPYYKLTQISLTRRSFSKDRKLPFHFSLKSFCFYRSSGILSLQDYQGHRQRRIKTVAVVVFSLFYNEFPKSSVKSWLCMRFRGYRDIHKAVIAAQSLLRLSHAENVNKAEFVKQSETWVTKYFFCLTSS